MVWFLLCCRGLSHDDWGQQPIVLSYDDIKVLLSSISDHNSFLKSNRDPIDYMMKFLTTYWKPDEEDDFGLGIQSGYGGSCITHSHRQQYMFVYQSLLLWRHIMHDMYLLWMACEADLLDTQNYYRLRDTGQGLNRMQSAPRVGRHMSHILSMVHAKVGYAGRQGAGWGGGWMGSSVVHLGDVDVPNGLVFIDKVRQTSDVSPVPSRLLRCFGVDRCSLLVARCSVYAVYRSVMSAVQSGVTYFSPNRQCRSYSADAVCNTTGRQRIYH